MKTRKTHVQKTREQLSMVALQVQNILRWDALKYASYQEEQGIAYLNHEFGELGWPKDLVNYKAFWSWWRMHWLRRDREFLDMQNYFRSTEEAQDYYQDLHHPSGINFRPHKAQMESTYKLQIHRLIKSIKP